MGPTPKDRKPGDIRKPSLSGFLSLQVAEVGPSRSKKLSLFFYFTHSWGSLCLGKLYCIPLSGVKSRALSADCRLRVSSIRCFCKILAAMLFSQLANIGVTSAYPTAADMRRTSTPRTEVSRRFGGGKGVTISDTQHWLMSFMSCGNILYHSMGLSPYLESWLVFHSCLPTIKLLPGRGVSCFIPHHKHQWRLEQA